MRPRSWCLFVGLALACGRNPQDRTDHPNQTFIVPWPSQDHSLRLASLQKGPWAAPAGIGSAPWYRFGRADGPTDSILGRIIGAATDSTDRLFLLDAAAGDVKVVGSKVIHVGRPGQGPGEFQNPTAMALDGTGRLYIADQRRVVQVFAAQGEGFVLEGTFRLQDVTPSSLCFLGDTLYAVGLADTDGPLVRAYDRSGKIIRSFGELYRSPNPLIGRQVNSGRLACNPSTGQVIFAARGMLGELRSYGSDGTPRWRVVITDFKPVHLRERPDGGFQVALPIGGFHRLHSLLALPNGDVVAQFDSVASDTPRPEGEFAKLYSIVLAGSDGHVKRALVVDRPLLAAGKGAIFSADFDSIPRVEAWRPIDWFLK